MARKAYILCAVAALIVLGITADLSWRAYIRPRFAVLVEGHVVGGVRRAEDAQKALEAVVAQITPDMQVQVNLPEKMTVRSLGSRERLSAVSEAEIQRALVATIPSLTQGMAITVNGRDIVGVADLAAAQAVRDGLLEEYRSTVLRDAAAVEVLKFEETIDWHAKLLRTENVRTVDEAMTILKYGTDKMARYVVRSGDTGWDIARSYNVTPDQLAKANPDVNLDLLQIGQALNVTFREPWVHTQSISKKVVQQEIPFREDFQKDPDLWPWQYRVVVPGVLGTRELTIRETRENGKVVKTDVIDSKVLKDPKAQMTRQGIKQVPPMGSGQLVFPIVGVITSYFGDRSDEGLNYHYGIDLGASVGTPVLAADNGMVVYRGWDGNYGNIIRIDHGGGNLETWYAHLSAFNVSLGDTVSKGQVIGYSGNTGFSTGPHLHYEVHVNGTAVNPLGFYK